MSSFFSYESKPMQILMYIGDLIILNLIYLLCCIPIFTIGAAQAGLYTALRVLQDPEDDSSPSAAFFRGFTKGFGKVTLSWMLLTVVLVLVAYGSILGYASGLPLWLCILSVCVCALFQALVPLFHSRFDCTAMQLIRNSWFLAFAHPLRSIASVALLWAPVLAFLIFGLYWAMALMPLWGTVYYGAAALFINLLMRKPFKTLIDHFNETHSQQAEEVAEAEALEAHEAEEDTEEFEDSEEDAREEIPAQ